MNNYQDHPLIGAVDIDSAMNMLWSFYKKYFIGLYLISVVMSLLTSLFTVKMNMGALQSTTDPSEMLELMKGMAGPYMLMILISLVIGVLLHSWVMEKPMSAADFAPAVLKRSLVAMIPYLITMTIFIIIAFVATTIGLVLLVLPGLFAIFYFATIMLFAMPVTLMETRNPFTVISRSFTLAHKNLWPNLGWTAVVILITLVITLAISALIMLPFSGSFIKSLTNPEEVSSMLELSRNPLYIGFTTLTSSLIIPVMPIFAFILYFRNRGDEVAVEISTKTDTTVRVEDLYPKMPKES